jgi:hypothetical protein
MAMVLPALLMLVFFIIQIGHGFLMAHVVKDTGRRACRLALCHDQSTESVRDFAQQLLARRGVKNKNVSVLVNQQETELKSAKPGDMITIRIDDSTPIGSPSSWANLIRLSRATSTSSARRE